MEINEFIEKYNYKQWNKMLKLKNLQYDIWDTDLENEGDQLISDLIDMIEGLINEN